MAAVEAKAEDLREHGWSDVVVMGRGEAFHSWEHERVAKSKGRRAYIAIGHRGDRTILAQANDNVVDLIHIEAPMAGDAAYQQLLVGRARVLKRMELAEKTSPLTWKLDPEIEQTLGDMGRRGDIIRTLHRDMAVSKWKELPSLKLTPEIAPRPLVIHGAPEHRKGEPEQIQGSVVGKVMKRGAANEDHERRYLVIDGVDGCSHYVDIGSTAEPTLVGALVRLEPKQAALRVGAGTAGPVLMARLRP